MLCIVQDLAQANHILIHYGFGFSSGKACVETENSSSNLNSIHFNNTPEQELGSPKLFENELIDPLSNSNFDIVQAYTGFWPRLYG